MLSHTFIYIFNFRWPEDRKNTCSSISKETNAAKRLLHQYAAAAYELSTTDPLPSLQEVLSLESDYWLQKRHVGGTDSIPWKTKQEIIQSHLMIKRCEVEVALLTLDMLATVTYWQDHILSINFKLKEIGSPKDKYEEGLRSLLQRCKLVAELQHHRAANSFSRFIHVPTEVMLDSSFLEDDFEFDSDSSEDSDTDTDTEFET